MIWVYNFIVWLGCECEWSCVVGVFGFCVIIIIVVGVCGRNFYDFDVGDKGSGFGVSELQSQIVVIDFDIWNIMN